uniref:FTP domain-containing protein n=1 Tax=Macrostomum lignano TaxID=282301 RepID=A0A1I8GPV7_9PLAT
DQQIQLIECRQSSTFGGAECVRAIDDNTNQDYHAGSCTHTEAHQGWWQARTEHLTHFKQIRIYNRMDCCSERLDYISIYIDGHLSAVYRGEPFAMKNFNVDRIGQVVRIQSHRESTFSLCEVQVLGYAISLPSIGEQLAFDSCSQSSTSYGGVCDRAIDGNITRATFTVQRGWWQGHLTKVSEVTHVRIYNRLDCCLDRLSDFAVLIDDKECASYRSEPDSFFSLLTLKCQGTEQLKFNSCSQSSTASGCDCKRAFDGIRNQDYHAGSCTHTENCCSDRRKDFLISVGGHECAFYRSDDHFSARNFECNAYGEVVRIDSHKAEPLILCEVEV